MTRLLSISLCIATSLTSIACRSEPQASSPTEEPTAAVDVGAIPDANLLSINDEDKITDRRTVESKYETLDDRRILRVRIDLITITISVEDAIAYFDRRVVELPHLTDEKALADKLRSERDVREYRYDDFLPGERDRVYFCVASLLEEGSFLMTLNDTGARVPRIIACKYSQIHGPMDGYAGRLFLLEDGRELFRTMDEIY
jgi:hypothetical protein